MVIPNFLAPNNGADDAFLNVDVHLEMERCLDVLLVTITVHAEIAIDWRVICSLFIKLRRVCSRLLFLNVFLQALHVIGALYLMSHSCCSPLTKYLLNMCNESVIDFIVWQFWLPKGEVEMLREHLLKAAHVTTCCLSKLAVSPAFCVDESLELSVEQA